MLIALFYYSVQFHHPSRQLMVKILKVSSKLDRPKSDDEIERGGEAMKQNCGVDFLHIQIKILGTQ